MQGYSAPVLVSQWGGRSFGLLCYCTRKIHSPFRMLHPVNPWLESDRWPHPENRLECGSRQPSVQQSASGPLIPRGVLPPSLKRPGCLAVDAAPLQSQTTALREYI